MNLFIIFALIASAKCYKILGLFPHPGKSHFDVFAPLMGALAGRGHEVTLVSHFPLDKSVKNYALVDLNGTFNKLLHVIDLETLPRGRLSHAATSLILSKIGAEVCEKTLASNLVQNFMKRKQDFDLIIIELFNSDCYLAFVDKFQVPFVGLSSCTSMHWLNGLVGNPANPSYVPNNLMDYSDQMTFYERMENVLVNIWEEILHTYYSDVITYPIVERYFGKDLPRLHDIAMNMSLLLTSTHFSVTGPKPAVPAVIDVLGMHLGKLKPLPKVIYLILV